MKWVSGSVGHSNNISEVDPHRKLVRCNAAWCQWQMLNRWMGTWLDTWTDAMTDRQSTGVPWCSCCVISEWDNMRNEWFNELEFVRFPIWHIIRHFIFELILNTSPYLIQWQLTPWSIRWLNCENTSSFNNVDLQLEWENVDVHRRLYSAKMGSSHY